MARGRCALLDERVQTARRVPGPLPRPPWPGKMAAWERHRPGATIAAMTDQLADVLDVPLHTAAGLPTALRAELGPDSTVVVFLRHFG